MEQFAGMIATVETPALMPRNLHTGNGKLTPDQKIEARTLYLVHGLGPKEISVRTGGDYRSLQQLISNAGWAKLKGKNWQKADADVQAKVEADIAEVGQRIAVESEELTVGSLRVLRDSISRGDAKSMQMASGAARNLVDIFRKCRGMDNISTQNQSTGTNLNFFVLPPTASPLPIKSKEPKNVTGSVVVQ